MKAAIALAALLAVASLAPGVASADPAFTAMSANILKTGLDQGDLLVKWAESGLSPGEEVVYQLTADASATYGCISTKTVCTTPPPQSVSRWFTLKAAGGTIRQTVSVDEPDPNLSDSCVNRCPAGNLVLFNVSYDDITITDTISGAHSELTGTLSLTFCKSTNLNNCPPPS